MSLAFQKFYSDLMELMRADLQGRPASQNVCLEAIEFMDVLSEWIAPNEEVTPEARDPLPSISGMGDTKKT